MLQVKSSRAMELEYLFVSFVVLWSCSSIFDSVPCKVSLFLLHIHLNNVRDDANKHEILLL